MNSERHSMNALPIGPSNGDVTDPRLLLAGAVSLFVLLAVLYYDGWRLVVSGVLWVAYFVVNCAMAVMLLAVIVWTGLAVFGASESRGLNLLRAIISMATAIVSAGILGHESRLSRLLSRMMRDPFQESEELPR